MFALLLLRAGISVAVAGIFGGASTLRHPLFLTFLGLEALLSIVEGRYSSGGARPSRGRPNPPPEQIPFILAGKYYLLSRTVYQVAILVWFAWQTRIATVGSGPVNVFGGALMLGGVALRWRSMALLGERFRSFEVKHETRGLETRGPYARLRHPGYLALALFDLGMPLLLSAPSLALLWVVSGAMMFRRMALEEQLLDAAYPGAYAAYVARTSRVVPGVH